MQADAIDETLRPFLWLRRITIASVALLLLLAIGRTIVGFVAERRWQATAARLREAGIHLDIRELQSAPIPDADNPAWYLRKAGKAIDPKDAGPRASSYTELELGAAPAYKPLWHQQVDASEIANAKVFELVTESRKHQRVDWGVVFDTPPFAILLPHLNDARALTNVLTDSGERAFVRGDSATGIERVRGVLCVSEALADRPFFITSLVQGGIDCMITDALAPHVASIRIGDGPGEATRAEVRGLIDDLLREELRGDEPPMRSRIARTEASAAITSGLQLAHSMFAARPVVMADVARVGEQQLVLTRAMDARQNAERARLIAAVPVSQTNWTAMSWRMPGGWGRATTGDEVRVSRPVTHTGSVWLIGRGLLTLDRAAVGRDAVAIMLALRMYELDHGGAWPATLESLVPDYLPTLPRNKISPDDESYGYRLVPAGLPDGRDRPLLLPLGTVAPSTATSRPASPIGGGSVIDLTSWQPTTAPSSEGIEE